MASGDVLTTVAELESIEKTIIGVLQDVADICEELSKIENTQSNFVKERGSKLLKRCHLCRDLLLKALSVVSLKQQTHMSSYGDKKDFEICHMKTCLIHELLASMTGVNDQEEELAYNDIEIGINEELI